MRFLADMGASWRTTEWLALRGYDVVHLVDQCLERASDSDIVKKATVEERIILTMDLDFAHLLAAGHKCTPSVILFRLTDEGRRTLSNSTWSYETSRKSWPTVPSYL